MKEKKKESQINFTKQLNLVIDSIDKSSDGDESMIKNKNNNLDLILVEADKKQEP